MALTPLGQAYQAQLKKNASRQASINTAQVASQTQVPTPGETSTGLAAAFNASKPTYPSSGGGGSSVSPLKALGDRIKAGENVFSQPLIPASSVSGSFNEVASSAPATATTNYGGKGNPLNEILYSKKQYDAGNKNWAANNAQQFYSALNPTESALVKGMNTQQLESYISSKNGSPSNISNVPSGSVTGAVSPNTTGTTGYQSTYTGPDMTAMKAQLEALYGNRQSAETQKLRDALATALQGYNSQQTQAQQSAYNSRNAADVTSAQNQQQMRETMANAGLNTDGQNLSLQAAQGASRLGAINGINQQESNALQDISQKRSLLQNNAAQNELALTQQIGSDKAAALFDLLKYGDTQAFNVDQSNYGRYRDSVNQQFQNDQFDWQKAMDEAGLTGQYGGQSTLAGKQANLNAALAVGDASGRLVSPTQNWGNLFQQASSGSAPLNAAGQQQQLNSAQVIAALTGKNPDGSATTAEQQRLLQNAWTTADALGYVNSDLSRLTGIPVGTQTLQAKQAYSSMSNATADNSRQNSSALFSKLMDLWKATGQAPAGIDGVTPGTPLYDAVGARSDSQPRTASPNEVGTLLQNLQLQGQDSEGKTYYYIPGKGKSSRNDWVTQTVQTLVDANYDNATIEQVLRKAGISKDEENQIFSAGK